jgi:RNA polymerase sigma factor (sigma-70 family)
LGRWSARDGTAGEFQQLMLPHLDAAYNLARFLSRDPAAADDIVQEAFLRAFRAFDGFRGGDAKSWLLAIVRNCSFDWAKSNPPVADCGATELDELPDVAQDTPESALMRNSEAEQVRALIESLPEPFRETLILRELEDLSYKQIAAITSVPIGTVMSRLARARQLLSSRLEPSS